MSRINYPEEFLRQTKLFANIKAKHDADGNNSPLIPFLAQHSIDLAADEQAVANAILKNTAFEDTDMKSEDYTQDRNNLFDPVFENLRKELQFLKKFYAGNAKELGNWGVTVDDNRIVYPPEFINRANLFEEVKKHHDSLGNNSPLTPFLTQNNIDINAELTDTNNAQTQHGLMQQAKRDAEKFSEERDILFDPVMSNVRAIAQYLKTLFVDHTKKLGDWGYTIDDSPRPAKFRTTTIAPGSTKTLTGVKLNSQLENTGTVDLLLHKGDVAGPNPKNLPPEMRFTITRGWGTITIENTSATEDGEIGYLTTNLGAG